MATRPPTLLSAFTGLGGLDLGLEMAGFKNVGCIEFDAAARASIRANHPHRRLIDPHDITIVGHKLKPAQLGLKRRELFILAGGPPCQPFSKAAQWSHRAMQGMKDPRSKCFAGFIHLIESFLPKVVLIENVQGFVSGRAGALTRLQRSLREINRTHGTRYRISQRIVDAADFGVPQRRSRAIIVALREGDRFCFPEPTSADRPVSAWAALRSLSHRTQTKEPLRHWARLLPSIPEGSNYLWHTRRGGGERLFGYRTRFWSFLLKLAKDAPSWTISAQPGPYTGPFHWDNRPLTPAEMLRLQSFPSSWKVRGVRAARVRQIGNATPPLLAEVIGRQIAALLLGKKFRGNPRLAIEHPARKPPPPRAPSAAPREFLPLVRRHRDHPGTGLGPAPIPIQLPDAKKDRQAA